MIILYVLELMKFIYDIMDIDVCYEEGGFFFEFEKFYLMILL